MRTRWLLCVVLTFAQSVVGTIQTDSDGLKQERDLAVWTLVSLLHDLRKEPDVALRIRVSGRICEVLWPFDRDQARDTLLTIFDESFEDSLPSNVRQRLRAELFAIAGRVDKEIAQTFLRLVDERLDKRAQRVSRETSETIDERGALMLDAAFEALRNGSKDAAIRYAEVAMRSGSSPFFGKFLTELSSKDPKAADALFLTAVRDLPTTAVDPNHVLLYGMWLVFRGEGAFGQLPDGTTAVSYGLDFCSAPKPSEPLVHTFLQSAYRALVRFPELPEGGEPRSSVALKRFALGQLICLYERYEPELGVMLRGELGAVDEATRPVNVRGGLQELLDLVSKPTESAVEYVETIPDPGRRDRAYFNLAQMLVYGGDGERARAFAAHIKSDDTKSATLELIDFVNVDGLVERKQLEDAERLASKTLRLDRRAIIFGKIAKEWFVRGDVVRAQVLINAATTEASKSDDRVQRARVYLFLAYGIADRDSYRAFELVTAAAKDVNTAEDVNSIDYNLRLDVPFAIGPPEEFEFARGVSFPAIAPALSRADFTRVLSIAASLRSRSARANTLLESCKAVLLRSHGNSGSTPKVPKAR